MDRHAFIVAYDQTTLNPTDIFTEIDQFADRAGFALNSKIEELLPEKKIVVRRRKGTPYEGGVFLTLIQHESGTIEIEGARLRGGCSSPIEIEELTVLRSALEEHLSDKFGTTIRVLPRDVAAP